MSDLKTLYLIRHAESLENERLACLARSISILGRFSLPSTEDLRRSAELINVPAQVDSDVSPEGWAQINQLGEKLRADDFLTRKNIQLVAHSPLSRARQTSEGMLGCVTTASSDEQPTLTAPVKRVEQLTCLLEKSPTEWIPGNYGGFAKRMAEFEAWVCDQPEEVMAIVGHSQFFKAMLEMDYKFGNCDVWEVTLDCSLVRDQSSIDSGGDDDAEEKKDDAAVIATPTDTESDNKDCATGTAADVPLPRGWRGLKKLYEYEKKEQTEE